MSAHEVLRVAIAGSGSAGPTAAILLAQQGHDVTLFEQAEAPLAVGAGFLLQPTGMSVLQKIGILEDLLPKTARVDHLFCENTCGNILLDLHYNEVGEEIFGAGTHRATLLALLLEKAEELGVSVEWDCAISGFKQSTPKSVEVFSKRECFLGNYDLLLICDGARSKLREQLSIPQSVSAYPWGALWFIGKRTPDFSANTLWQSVESSDQLTGFLPTGTDEDLLSMFWSVRTADFPKKDEINIDTLKADILKLAPQAESFLKQINHPDQLQAATYYDVRMKQWHEGRVAILGDAAHALSPQLGQGVNLALMDASVLADSLTTLPVVEALTEYSKRRKKHTRFYQFATRWSTPLFQSDYPLVAALRDVAFPIAGQIPWMRKQMTKTMAGLKTGPFSEF